MTEDRRAATLADQLTAQVTAAVAANRSQDGRAAKVASHFIELVKSMTTTHRWQIVEQAFRSFFDSWSVTIEVLQDLATLFGTAWDSKALASDLKGPGKRIAMEGKWITAFEDWYHEHIPGCYKVLQHGRESGSNGAGGGRERRQGRNKN